MGDSSFHPLLFKLIIVSVVLTIVIRDFQISTNTDHEICNREMYEEESHLVPVLAEDPLLE